MTDGQWTWAGHTFGPGTDDIVQSSLIGAPEIRHQSVLLPQNHGGVGGADFAGFREVEVEMMILRSSRSQAWADWQAWHARMQPTAVDGELTVVGFDGVPYLLFARPEPLVVRWIRGMNKFAARARWIAYDPALYSATLQSVQVDPYTLSGGLSYPVTYPKVYGTGGEGGGVTVTNGGSWPSWPRFLVDGPPSGSVSVLAVEDATNGNKIEFDGLTVGEGSTLVVDTHPARRLVAFTSGADRMFTVRDLDSWWSVPPGESEIRFRAIGDPGATLTTELRSAWL